MNDQEDIIILVVLGTILFILIGGFVISFLVIYQTRQRKYRRDKEILINAFDQELLRSQLEMKEQTLQNISEEIHDNIGQTLSLVKLHLNRIDVESGGKAFEQVLESRQLLSKAISDLRGLAKNLNTEAVLATGLMTAIANELDAIQKTGTLDTELSLCGEIEEIHPQIELIVFRIVQEALNNIVKHSEANCVKVFATFSPEWLELEIQDNGRGSDFINSVNKHKAGIGIKNMQSRAKLIGGSLRIESSTSSGTKVFLTAPIRKK